jgi:hypothetical protein
MVGVLDGSPQTPEKLEIPRFAVIPTKGNRMSNLDLLIPRLHWSSAHVIIVDTSHTAAMSLSEAPWRSYVQVILDDDPINISRWWNYGLDWAQQLAERGGAERWDVAILNDDCLPSVDWFKQVSKGMRTNDSAAACSGTSSHTLKIAEPINLWFRMTGWAFMLAGEKGVRGNEDLAWWYSDDHIDWAAREAGGMTMVPFGAPEHFHENGQMTPDLQVQAAADRQTFIDRWGRAPW